MSYLTLSNDKTRTLTLIFRKEWGERLKRGITCTYDNLVIYVDMLHIEHWQEFFDKLQKAEMDGKIPNMRFSIGKGRSEYHYKLNISQGGGAISIGYKHNSSREFEGFYTMRVEFNPNKQSKLYEGFWEVFRSYFHHYQKKVKQVDIAFDVPIDIKKIIAVSLTGRQKSYFHSTTYYGSSGNHGRLKIYDKKTELEEVQDIKIEGDLTRIEYTIKFEEPITFQLLSKAHLTMMDEYEISLINVDDLKGELKAAILAIYHGYMSFGEFTRTTKTKIKSALQDMEKLDLDHAYISTLVENVKKIKSYISQV